MLNQNISKYILLQFARCLLYLNESLGFMVMLLELFDVMLLTLSRELGRVGLLELFRLEFISQVYLVLLSQTIVTEV